MLRKIQQRKLLKSRYAHTSILHPRTADAAIIRLVRDELSSNRSPCMQNRRPDGRRLVEILK
ncbi:hypothetical protein [uncultured Slackia sp.]|uniref:hypothetical protein n=1 Tax=uncultured Slackia sp. TaxID=665903 RepID=UPI0025DCFF08|nr:hypothetical protein [uncultured Slackia sp.]